MGVFYFIVHVEDIILIFIVSGNQCDAVVSGAGYYETVTRAPIDTNNNMKKFSYVKGRYHMKKVSWCLINRLLIFNAM